MFGAAGRLERRHAGDLRSEGAWPSVGFSSSFFLKGFLWGQEEER